VRFNCEALLGYDKAKSQAELFGQHTIEEVCGDGRIAAGYSSSAVAAFDTM